MKLKFCGAARCVTGSCHMLCYDGGKVLIDCGMRQGADEKGELGASDFAFDPKEVDAVLLTHAHIDHSGLLPLLVKRGFDGKIITTKATAELSGIMLPDSAKIQEQDAEYQNRKNLRGGGKGNYHKACIFGRHRARRKAHTARPFQHRRRGLRCDGGYIWRQGTRRNNGRG